MKDMRGVDIVEGKTAIFARSTGSFGGHKIAEGKIVKVCPKTVTIGYINWNGKYKEGNYYPNSFILVDVLPTPNLNTQLKAGEIFEVFDWDLDNLVRAKTTTDTYEQDDELCVEYMHDGRRYKAEWNPEDFRWESN